MNLCSLRLCNNLRLGLLSSKKTKQLFTCAIHPASMKYQTLTLSGGSVMKILSRQVHQVARLSRSQVSLQHINVTSRSLKGSNRLQGLRCLLGSNTSLFQQERVASQGPTESEKQELISKMSMRLLNENSFLSWCRNAYLSTVVGVAMISEGASMLAQAAGLGAMLIGSMNLFWGTACHVTNLIRLRRVSGMNWFNLLLQLLGSTLHCFLFFFVLICYIGFLDEAAGGGADAPSIPEGEGPMEVRRMALIRNNNKAIRNLETQTCDV